GQIFFVFQAQDGIRCFLVTGVQTCALPISARDRRFPARRAAPDRRYGSQEAARTTWIRSLEARCRVRAKKRERSGSSLASSILKIGRASCRERADNLEG